MSTRDRIISLARMAEKSPDSVGVLSTGERCAVGLLCNRADFLPGNYTFLEAVARLEGDWLAACIEVDRQGWRE